MYNIVFEVPYTPFLSKNKKFAYRTHKFEHPNYKKAKAQIAFLFKNALKSYPKPTKGKTIIDYVWYRKTMVGDTSNLREAIDDAIKTALPYDDNYFVGRHDYIVNKEGESRVLISVTIISHE